MAHFLRGKQAGIQNDFSARITPDLFALDDVSVSTPRVSFQRRNTYIFEMVIKQYILYLKELTCKHEKSMEERLTILRSFGDMASLPKSRSWHMTQYNLC